MAKKTIVKWESDVISDVIFTTEENMREFDKKINDNDFYLGIAKNEVKHFLKEVEINDYDIDGDTITLILTTDLCCHIKRLVEDNFLVNTPFCVLINYIEEEDYNDYIEDKIVEYICNKIDKLKDDINNLFKIKIK